MKAFFISATLLLAIASCSTQEENEEVLLYLSVRDKDYNIFKNDLSGNETQLTNNPGFDYAPMFNKTSASIIYYSYVSDSFLVANMNLDGQPVQLETYGQQEFNLSPDGERLVSQVNVGDTSVLVLSNLLGTETDTIASLGSYNGRAKWSWQSDQIAYISDRDGDNEVFIYRLENKSTEQLTKNTTFEKYISWSPDGSKLAYTTQFYEEGKPDRNDVYVMNINTKSSIAITNNDYNDTELAWSPISNRIAFHSTRGGEDHIFIMNSDGSNEYQVTTTKAYHGEPCWAWK